MDIAETYLEECPHSDCDFSFISITFDDFVEHLEEEHSKYKAKLYEELVVGKCDKHGVYELEGYGNCPECIDIEDRTHLV